MLYLEDYLESEYRGDGNSLLISIALNGFELKNVLCVRNLAFHLSKMPRAKSVKRAE